MSSRIFLAIDHHAAFRCGGWGFVRDAQGARSGGAGGDKAVSGQRTALLGLAAALRDAPAGPILLHTNSGWLAGLGAMLSDTVPEAIATADSSIWNDIRKTAAGRDLRIVPAKAEPRTALAFAAAWAELARDKAKMTGAFSAPIPKTNLAKVPGL